MPATTARAARVEAVSSGRRDASRNRARILTAAKKVVASQGEQADVREIARAAGVGMGTLYRHFGTKRALLDAALAPELADWAEAARGAVATDGGWVGLRRFLVDALARQAAHRGLAERYADSLPPETPAETETCRRQMHPIISELVAQAHDDGTLRADVTADDVALLLIGLARITEVMADPTPHARQRLLDMVLDGLRTHPADSHRTR